MDINIEEHPMQIKPAKMGPSNSVKSEDEKCFAIKGVFKRYFQEMYTCKKPY